MKLVDIVQGSNSWHQFRRLHIGASESSVLLGVNPWKTPLQLWEEKVMGWEEPMNDKMKRGQEMEEPARAAYQLLTNTIVIPVVAVHDKYDYISASFDGLTEDYKRGVEIKCGKSSHKLAQSGECPPYYFTQCQAQMLVADLSELDYFSFDGKEGILLNIKRDDELISQMLDIYAEFWDCVLSKTPPKGLKDEFPF